MAPTSRSRQGTVCSSDSGQSYRASLVDAGEAAKPRPHVAEVREVFDDGVVVVDEQCGDASPGEPVPGAQEVFPLAARGAEVEVVSPVPAKRAAAHVNVFQHGETKTVEFG